MAGVDYSGRYDAIVVGVGAMGSATAYHLARRGKRVLGLERFGVPHSMGSSHGHTRIIRLAYLEHPSYVLLLRRAYELWREIQSIAGEQLLYITGSIDAGPEDSFVFKGSWESCKLHDLPHEVLTGAELRRRYPGYHLPVGHLALLQPEGGFLTPERCIVSYVMAAQSVGAEIHSHEKVLEWVPLDGGVRVRTDRDTYEADKLVVTAGAWNGELLNVLAGLAVPERQVLAWLQPTRPEYFRSDTFPSSTCWWTRADSTASRCSACRASSSASTTTSRRRPTPTRWIGRHTTTTSGFCGTSPSGTSRTVAARRWTSRPACLPTSRTTTSS